MRKETFILTLIHDPLQGLELRGRVRHVTTGFEATFVGIGELAATLRRFIQYGKEAQDETREVGEDTGR